jgi:DNA-binding beta-propeller fold protein YncE
MRPQNHTAAWNAPRRIMTVGLGITALWVSPSFAFSAQILYQGSGYTPGKALSRPLGIFFDKGRNETYIADTGNHQVIVYDDAGMPLYRFYHNVETARGKQLGEPKSIVVDSQGLIFLSDAAVPYLDVLDHRGRRVKTISPPDQGRAAGDRFDYLALGPNDRVYATIACGEKRSVAVITPDLEIERVIHLEATADEMLCTTGIGVDGAGKIYITDPCGELMVQVYDVEGRFQSGFGRHDTGFENFSFPAGIVVMPGGEIWVVDTLRQIASCFNLDGEFLSYIGGKGSQIGAFEYPTALATDGKDRLFVLERAGERFQCFQISRDAESKE